MHPEDCRVVSNLIMQALRGEPITIYGDGSQTPSLCYVDDLIECLIRLIATPPEYTRPVNLGNPNEFTIRQLAEQVLTLVGGVSELVETPLPEDDPKQRQPDITLAQSKLGWELTVPLSDGLPKTIEYFKALSSDGR